MKGPRRITTRLAAVFGCLAASLLPCTVQAAATGVPSAASLTDAELGPRNYTQRGANKIRQGSLLKAEGADVKTLFVDLQGDLGHRRDQELQTHYSRLAELDYLAELAAKAHNMALAERIETTRRKEVERFFGVMQEIRVRAMPKTAEGS